MAPSAEYLQRQQQYKREDAIFNYSLSFGLIAICLVFAFLCMR